MDLLPAVLLCLYVSALHEYSTTETETFRNKTHDAKAAMPFTCSARPRNHASSTLWPIAPSHEAVVSFRSQLP